MGLFHRTTATLADEVGAEVNKGEWNDNHIIQGASLNPEADDTTDFGTATQRIKDLYLSQWFRGGFAILATDSLFKFQNGEVSPSELRLNWASVDSGFFTELVVKGTGSLVFPPPQGGIFDVAAYSSTQTIATDDILKWDGGEWRTTGESGGGIVSHDIISASHLDTSGVANTSDVLQYNGTDWVSDATLSTITITDPLFNTRTRKIRSALNALGAAETVDISTAEFFTATLDANTAITFSNPAVTGQLDFFTIEFTQDTTGGFTPTFVDPLIGTPVFNTTSNDVTTITFYTTDGGSNYTVVNQEIIMSGEGAFSGAGVFTLQPTAISDKTTITTVDNTNDFVLVWDATDSLLKKAAPDDVVIAQSPWTLDHDADGFDLVDLSNIEFRTSSGAPGGAVQAIYADAGGININVPSGDLLDIQVNGISQMTVSVSTIDFQANTLVDGIVNSTITGVSGITGLGVQTQELDMGNDNNIILDDDGDSFIGMFLGIDDFVEIKSGSGTNLIILGNIGLFANNAAVACAFRAQSSVKTAANEVSHIEWMGDDSGDAETKYAQINAICGDPTAGAERGEMELQVPDSGAGVLTNYIKLDGTIGDIEIFKPVDFKSQAATNLSLDADLNTVTNIGSTETATGIISGQTQLATLEVATDFVLMFDASANSLKKTVINDLPSGSYVKGGLTDGPWLIDGSEVSGVVTTLLNIGTNAIQGQSAGQSLTGDTGGWNYDVATSDSHDFRINNVATVTIAGSVINAITSTFQEAGIDISPIGTHTQWIPAGAWGTVTTNGATFAELEHGTNDIMTQTFDFATTAVEKVQFWWEPPAEWNAGVVTFNVKWTAAGTTGDVDWTLAGHSYSDNDVIDAAIGGTPATVTDASQTTDTVYISSESGNVTINGATKGEAILLQLSRPTADTLNFVAKMIGVNLTFTSDEATKD